MDCKRVLSSQHGDFKRVLTAASLVLRRRASTACSQARHAVESRRSQVRPTCRSTLRPDAPVTYACEETVGFRERERQEKVANRMGVRESVERELRSDVKGLARGGQRWPLSERGTTLKLPRRTCPCEYGLHPCSRGLGERCQVLPLPSAATGLNPKATWFGIQ
jgi:hypothetical protein